VRGLLITLEGPEGAGKTTQALRLKAYLEARKIPVIHTREPGGTPIGDRIREILLDPQASEMSLRAEILLYAASRAQLVDQLIRPALKAGKTVICDRYVDSSIVYQAYGAEGDHEEVVEVNRMATGALVPDRTYLLDLPLEEGDRRLKERGSRKDRMELKEAAFHQRVREGFLKLAQKAPERFCVLDATEAPDQVFQRITGDLTKLQHGGSDLK